MEGRHAGKERAEGQENRGLKKHGRSTDTHHQPCNVIAAQMCSFVGGCCTPAGGAIGKVNAHKVNAHKL